MKMAVIASTQSRIVDFHSQSSSSVHGNHVAGASHDACQLLRNTEAFEDDVGFSNRVVRLESPRTDTELVVDLDCSENLTIPTFEYEDDVVLDSEDEGIDGSRLIRVSSTLSRSEARQKVESDAQEENMAMEVHSSDRKQCDTGERVSSNSLNGVNMGKDSSQPPARLSYCSSQEPGESTQVNALGFVDNFLSLSTAHPSQEIGHRKAARVHSPLLSRIQGPQSLAKRIGRKSIEETRSFEWADFHDQEAECNLSGNCEKATLDFHTQNIVKLDNKEVGSLLKKYEDREASADIQFQIDSTASTVPHPRLDICTTEMYGMDSIEKVNKSNKESNAKLAEEQFGSMDDEGDAVDEFDIGISTQIAAEAMEALSSCIPDSNNIANACSPENALDTVPCDVIEHKSHLDHSYPHKIGGIVRKSKRTLSFKRKFHANCLNTYQARDDCQELESVLTTKRKAKRGRRAVQEQLNYRNSPNGSNCSATSSNLLSEAGSCQLSQRSLTNGDQVTITSLIVGLWSHPRRRRTPRNFQSHPYKSSNQNDTFLAVNGRRINSILTKNGTKTRGNQETSKPISVVSSYPHEHGERYNSDRYLADHVNDKSGSVSRISHGKNVSRSSFRCDAYHKTTLDKISPKPSSKELARLSISESMPDLKWKDLRRRRTMALVRVCFSQHLDEATMKQQKRVVLQLGISIASSSADATHFVADKFVRTRNMLEAIALGKPVVTHSWLECCGQASCFIDEKNYILRDIKKEKEIGFNLPVSLSRATQHPLLKGLRVLVTRNIRPDKEIITSLIKMSQGEPIERSQIFTGKNERIPHDLLILSCEEDYVNCVPFLRKGASVYSSELLLNGIVIQKLEHKRHELFTDRMKGFNAADNQKQ